MKNCFAYIRVSTQKQEENSVSLREQRSAIEYYAARKDIEITEWFEESHTAAKAGRPKFDQMIELLKKGNASGAVMHKIDRSARNINDWASVSNLVDTGIEFHFAVEGLDLASRGGRIAAEFLATVAADYSRNLSAEVKKGMYGRLKEGLYPWAAPPGYLNMGKGKRKEIDPVNGPLMHRAFELYATGEFSIQQIIEKLQIRHSKMGNVIHRNGLSRAFHNPFYMGAIHMKKNGETYQGIHKPLISKKLFDQVQDVLAGNFRREDTKHCYRYARLFKCAECSYALTAEKQKGNIYYRCHQRTCPMTSIREEMLDQAVIGFFKSLALKPSELAALKIKISELVKKELAYKKHLNEGLEVQLHKVNEHLDRLTDAMVDGLIEKDIFQERRKNLLLNKTDLERKMANSDQLKGAFATRVEKFFELMESPIFSQKFASHDDKVKLLKTVSSNRLVCSENVEIEPREPWRHIQNLISGTTGAPSLTAVRTCAENIMTVPLE